MIFFAIAGKFIVGFLADSIDVRHLFVAVAVFHIAFIAGVYQVTRVLAFIGVRLVIFLGIQSTH